MLQRLLDRAVLWISSTRMTVLVGRASRWQVLESMPVGAETPQAVAAQPSVNWLDALQQLISGQKVSARLRGLSTTAVLAPGLTPTLLLDLGREPLLHRARQQFAQLRMRQCFGAEIDSCSVFLDESSLEGAALAFAAPTRLLDALQAPPVATKVRVRSACPAMSWSWNLRRDGHLENGWFCLVGERDLVLTRILRGKPVSLNGAMEVPQTTQELCAAVRREALRLGLESPEGTIVAVDACRRAAETVSLDGFRLLLNPVLPNIALEADPAELRAAA